MPPPIQTPLVSDEGIVAHLFYATTEIEVVSVQVGRDVFSGTLRAPEADHRTVGFLPDEDQDIPPRALRAGKVMRVRYASLSDEYAFRGAFHSLNGKLWRIRIPHIIDRKDRRLIPRRDVLDSKRFTAQFDGTRRLLVMDLSPAGFAVLIDARLDNFEIGETHRVVLHIPDRPALRSRCTVVNIRHIEDDRSFDVIGCCFTGLGFAGCRVLAQLLAEWR
jgi:hypothetical protein